MRGALIEPQKLFVDHSKVLGLLINLVLSRETDPSIFRRALRRFRCDSILYKCFDAF